MELSEMINEASTAFVEKQYHTACYKYGTVLKLLLRLNINSNNNDQVIIQYMLCKTLIELSTLQDILRALEILIKLKKSIGNSFPAIYYAMGKAYIKLYRFNSALDAINTGLTIANTSIHFQQICMPMTSITIKESTKEGLLTALMNLHDEASSWHCPDAKCYMEDCKNNVSHCLPCRDIFFRDPAFTGLVVVTCSNTNNPCKFKFHPVCWDFQKEKLYRVSMLSDQKIIGHPCLTLDCSSDNGMSIITKIEVLDNNQTITSITQQSSLLTKSMSNTPVQGAIKKYPPQLLPKLRRPNLSHCSTPKRICNEEQPSKVEIEKETRLVKLIKLRETNFGTSSEQDLKLNKDRDENENLDSTTEILSDLIFKDNETETIQQCRFIFEIIHEFVKSNLMVHTDKVLLKWHETRGIMEHTENIDEYLDSDIMELLLKSPKFINIGNYICIPGTLGQALQIFEREIIEQCKFILPSKTQIENGDAQPLVTDFMSHKSIVTNFENQTDQTSQKLLSSTNNSDENINNNICQSSNMCETSVNSTKSNCLDEEETIIFDQTKNVHDWSIEESLLTFPKQSKDKMDFSTSRNDKSFFNSNDIKRNNSNFTNSMLHEDNSQNSIKYPLLKENTTKNVLENNFQTQLPNDDHSSKFIILQEKYTQLMTNYSNMKQAFIVLTKEKTDMEKNLKLELAKKNSLMEAIIEERKILIERLETYESQIVDDVPVKYETLNKGIVTLQAEISRLKQEKLDDNYNMKLLLKEKHVVENTLEKNNTELFETIKNCQAEVNKKTTELITFQEKNLELKKCMLEKSLESQFFHKQNILYQGIKHCQIAIEIFDNLNFITKNHFGLNIIPNYAMWLQALNYLQAEYNKMEGNYLQLKSLLESKTEVEKMDKIAMNSINLPPCPNRSLGTVLCEAFMLFYTHITRIPQQGFAFGPPPLLMTPHIMPYIRHPVKPNKPNSQPIIKANIHANSASSNINLTQTKFKLEKKHTEDKNQNISHKSDSDKENNERTPDNLQCTNNSKEVLFNLKGDKNTLDDKMKEHVKDNNSIIAETKTNEIVPADMINSDVLNTFNENTLVSMSNDVSNNTDCKLVPEKKIEEALDKNNVENTKKSMSEMLINSTDKIMNILRNKYTGMSDLLLLKSLSDLRRVHNGTLTGIPLNVIIHNIEKYVLSYQIDHLCTYIETKKIVKESITVLKGSKKPPKGKVKKKSTNNSIQLKPLMDLAATKSSLECKKNEDKSIKLTSLAGAIKKEPISLAKCPWDVIFKPGMNKNNYGESECVICMESLQEIDKLIYTLDCQHKFHKTCIKEWFQKNQSCPTCRIHCTIDEEYPPLP